MEADPKDVVRRGYDAVSMRYDEFYDGESKYAAWLAELGLFFLCSQTCMQNLLWF